MLTVLEIIKRSTDFFASKGIESPRLNAELLIGHALALKRMQLYLQFERPLTDVELDKIRPLIRLRGQHEPVQYITGETDFHGLRLKVGARNIFDKQPPITADSYLGSLYVPYGRYWYMQVGLRF